ncbi:MAG TPA: serine--tRNA ligase, partial [Actinomycetota bacterium]|nr:serine--tRNA ligase [Actinomycetota bacterium]
LQIGETLDMIDVERGARTSGSRFAYIKGQLALLEFALVRYAMGTLVDKGFTPVVPPVLVRREAMEGTGFLPTDEAQIYKLPEDDLYLVGTSEVPLAALHQDEYLPVEALPLRYAGFSTCFRREAGTYGKDTRGIFRVHQFDKVEMFSFTTPEQSWEEHEFLLSVEEGILKELQIPYRVMNIAAGDLGQPAAKKYDVEAWMPGQAAYREVTSCSNCTDYQARRLNCRIKTESGPQFVHTLNGTAIAVGRMLIAIMENNQREDGSVHVPHVLVPYAGFELLGPTT